MSSGQKTTTTRQSDAPWAPAQDGLKQTIGMAENWLDSPAATQTYQGTRVIPFSQQTLAGMNQMTGIAQGAQGAMQNPLQAYSGMFDYLTPQAQGDFSGDKRFTSVMNNYQSMLDVDEEDEGVSNPR